MRGKDQEFFEITSDPLIYLLALIIGLIVLLFIFATRVQASLPEMSNYSESIKEKSTKGSEGFIDIEKSKGPLGRVGGSLDRFMKGNYDGDVPNKARHFRFI